MRVSDYMSEDPVYVNTTATIGEAVLALIDSRARHLPVLDRGAVVGVVSDRDLRGAFPGVGERLADLSVLMTRLEEPVTDLMSRDVVSMTPDRDLQDAVDALIENRIGAVPVVDPDSNKLVGILSYVDALRAMKELAWR